MGDKEKVETKATSMSCNNPLTELCEQYDQEMADIEMDLDIHAKLIKLMRETRATNEQNLSSMQKNMGQREKEQQLLDEKTNDLIQNVNSQGEKIEQLKRLQKEIMNGINEAQQCLLAAQNTAKDDLKKLCATEKDALKFLENNLASPDFSDVALKLQNYQKTFTSKVQESIDSLAPLKSIGNEAVQLEDFEKVLKEMRMDAVNLEKQIDEVDAECLVFHEKIAKLNAAKEKEKQRRNTITEKYKQRKERVDELTLALNNRQNDKKLISESMNAKELELNKNKERLEKKSADAATIQQEVDMMKEKLAKLEELAKFEQEKHEQKVQEIKEAHETDSCALKSLLMELRESESAVLKQIQKARDDINKKTEWEAYKKINEEMERSLEQLKQQKAELQLAVDEKESVRSAQISKIEAIKSALQANKLGIARKREILMEEVKRLSDDILGLKNKIAEGERRLKAKRNAVDKQLNIATSSKKVSELVHCVGVKGDKVSQESERTGEPPLTSQEPPSTETDKVEKNVESGRDMKTGKSGNETIAVADPIKLILEDKSAENEKLNSAFIVSESNKPLPVVNRNEEKAGTELSNPKQEESKLSQPITKYKASNNNSLLTHNLPDSKPKRARSGSSKTSRQTRKKRAEAPHDSAAALFDSDVSVSTIKPMCASTPLLQKKDESSACNDRMEDAQKKRGRPRGKKAATGALDRNGNSKITKKKDAYDLDSDFD